MAEKKLTPMEVLAKLRKENSGYVGTLDEFDLEVDGYSTGNISLDAITQSVGFPQGRIVECYGEKSSGKTTSALQAMGIELQRIEQSGEESYVMFFDYERTLDPKYMANLGVPIDSKHLIYVKPKNLEHGANIFREMLATGSVKIAVFDSVAAMVSEKEQEAATGAITVADRAKAMHQFCRQIVGPVEEFGTSVIFLNHLLEKIDTFAASKGIKTYTRPGGKALDFYASLALEFKRMGEVKGTEFSLLDNGSDAKSVLGQRVLVKVAKFKAGEAFGTVELRIRQGRGFSQEFSVLSILTSYGVVDKASTGIYSWPVDMVPEAVKSKAKNGVLKIKGEHTMLKALEASAEWMKIATDAARKKLVDVQNERLGIETVDKSESQNETVIEVVEETDAEPVPLSKGKKQSAVEFVDDAEALGDLEGAS